MKPKWLDTLNHFDLNNWFSPEKWLASEEEPSAPEDDLAEKVEAAKQEWVMALRYYDSVSDPDLIDHAVYQIRAAEKKYTFLLKLAREKGVTHSPYFIEH